MRMESQLLEELERFYPLQIDSQRSRFTIVLFSTLLLYNELSLTQRIIWRMRKAREQGKGNKFIRNLKIKLKNKNLGL